MLSLVSKCTGLNLGGEAEDDVGDDLRLSTELEVVWVMVKVAEAAEAAML